MYKRYLFIVFVWFLAASAFAYRGEVFIIEMTKEGFLPQEIEIVRDQKVVFENLDTENHWPELRLKAENNFGAGLLKAVLPKEHWGYEFAKAGLWELRDRNFPEFSGSILVKEDSGYTPGRPEERPGAAKSGKFSSFLKKIFQYFLTLLFLKNEEIMEDLDLSKILNDEAKLVAYIKKFGAGKAIAQIEKSASSEECHRAAHLVGKHAYQIFKNNAFQWHAVAYDAACNSGFFHGAMDELRKNGGSVEGVCDNSPMSFKCAHDIGHSLMAAGDYQLYDVLKKCEALSEDLLNREECFRGTFMENADGGINRQIGHGSKYLSEDPLYPCAEIPEKYRSACWQFAMGRFAVLYDKNYTAMLNACARIPAPHDQMCFSSVGSVVAFERRENINNIAGLCLEAAAEKGKTMCAIGAAGELISNPKTRKRALDFCGLLKRDTIINNCYNAALAEAKTLLAGNFEKFCESLVGEQKSSCLIFKKPHYIINQ